MREKFLSSSDCCSDDEILLIADFGRSAQGWLSYMLCYVLNARFIEPYTLLVGTKYTGSKVISENTKGELPGRTQSRYKMVVKTHATPHKVNFDLTHSVIYLTRDPRDVAVSYRYLSLKLIREGAKSPSVLLQAIPLLGFLSIAFRWRHHVKRWKNKNILHVRYEDLRKDTSVTLERILETIQIKANQKIIDEAIDLFSFENTYGRKRGQEDKNNPEARKGQIGDYRNHFSPLLNWFFWSICGKQAEEFGYRYDGATTVEPS